jgi:transcription initiation factor TFIIB
MMHDKGLHTEIGIPTRSRRPLTTEKKRQLYRMIRLQSQLSIKERTLATAMNEINRISTAIKATKHTQETAATIFRRALDNNLLRGRSTTHLAAACVLLACRQTDTPRTLKEILQTTGNRTTRRDVGRSFRFLHKELNLELTLTSDSTRYVAKIAEKSGISQQTQQSTLKLITQFKETGKATGKTPSAVAAAALYISSVLNKESVGQKRIAEAADVTEVTIRNVYKVMVSALSINLHRGRGR